MKGTLYITELNLNRGGILFNSCTKEKAIELTIRYSPHNLKKFFPITYSQIKEG